MKIVKLNKDNFEKFMEIKTFRCNFCDFVGTENAYVLENVIYKNDIAHHVFSCPRCKRKQILKSVM